MFDGSVILCVASINVAGKYFNGIGYSMNEINPSISSIVIYECNIVVRFAEGGL